MRRPGFREVQEAAERGEGFCLACGKRQRFYRGLRHKPLCSECDEYEVVAASELLRVMDFVQEEE